MPRLNISLEGDNCWPDLADKREQVIHITEGFSVAALSGGMQSGKASVAVRIDLPDGTTVVAETSMRLFLTAADMFRARYRQEV